MSVVQLGCCGAYCGTCPALGDQCRGCKLGYQDGTRDISKAKCEIKVCCITKGFESCADCECYGDCHIAETFYEKKGHKYKKYREAIEFIRSNGYPAFLRSADTWKAAYGRYE